MTRIVLRRRRWDLRGYLVFMRLIRRFWRRRYGRDFLLDKGENKNSKRINAQGKNSNMRSTTNSFKMVTKDRTFYCCCLGSDGIYGLALFYSKLDLCTRFESAVSTLWKKSDRCFINGKKGKRLKPRMYDVRSGEEVCFEGVEQQKKAWKGNKRFFRKYEDFEKGVETGRIFWGGENNALHYATSIIYILN